MEEGSVARIQKRIRGGALRRFRDLLAQSFRDLWKWRGRILPAALVLIVLAAVFNYTTSFQTAHMTMSLDYEEASKGLTPNSTRFNVYEIRTEDVLSRLLEYAGLEGQVTTADLAECISIAATHVQSVNGDQNYISTSYDLQFRNKGIPGRSAASMMALLCKTYREYFMSHYAVNYSILNFDIAELHFNQEYVDHIDLLKLKSNQLKRYVEMRMRENKNYRDPETGITFPLLQQRLLNYAEYDLEKLRAYVVENGISAQRDRLLSALGYRQRTRENQYRNRIKAFETYKEGIPLYDTTMSAAVMIPTKDSQLEYYMSRTKTGLDTIVSRADDELAGASLIQEEIAYDTYLIGKLRDKTPTQTQYDKAGEMVAALEKELREIASDLQRTDESYIVYRAHDYLSFKDKSPGMTARVNPAGVFLTVLAFCCVVFVILFIRRLTGREGGEA